MIIALPNKHARGNFLNYSADPAAYTEWSCYWHESFYFQILTLPGTVCLKIIPGSVASVSSFLFLLVFISHLGKN